MKSWNDTENKTKPDNERLIVELIDPCLTSVYQPPDVAMIKDFKLKVRILYQNYINKLSKTSLKPGDKVALSRETLVEMIVKAIDEINLINKKTRRIAQAFRQCGVDPWVDNQDDFMKHLESLNQNSV